MKPNKIENETIKLNENGKKAMVPLKIIHAVEPQTLTQIEVSKNIYLRIVQEEGEKYIDVRKFYKNFPTKKGLRFKLDTFNSIKNMLNEYS